MDDEQVFVRVGKEAGSSRKSEVLHQSDFYTKMTQELFLHFTKKRFERFLHVLIGV